MANSGLAGLPERTRACVVSGNRLEIATGHVADERAPARLRGSLYLQGRR